MILSDLALLRDDGVTTTTFKPLSNVKMLTKWQEDDLTIPVAERESISTQLRPASNNVKRKVTTKVNLPYRPASIDGITQPLKHVEFITYANVPEDAPVAVIKDAAALAIAAQSDALIEDIYLNGRAPV